MHFKSAYLPKNWCSHIDLHVFFFHFVAVRLLRKAWIAIPYAFGDRPQWICIPLQAGFIVHSVPLIPSLVHARSFASLSIRFCTFWMHRYFLYTRLTFKVTHFEQIIKHYSNEIESNWIKMLLQKIQNQIKIYNTHSNAISFKPK